MASISPRAAPPARARVHPRRRRPRSRFVEVVGRLGARLILQRALEDEVTEYLGRGRYERTDAPAVHRNGYEPTIVRTTSGPVELERPRLRNASQLDFASRVVGKGVARTRSDC